MVRLDHRDATVGLSDVGEAFSGGIVGEGRVELAPLLLLAGGRGGEVLRCRADLATGVGRGNLDGSTLEVLEEDLGVLLLVVGGLREDGGDLLVTLLLGHAGEVRVAVACLRLAGE